MEWRGSDGGDQTPFLWRRESRFALQQSCGDSTSCRFPWSQGTLFAWFHTLITESENGVDSARGHVRVSNLHKHWRGERERENSSIRGCTATGPTAKLCCVPLGTFESTCFRQQYGCYDACTAVSSSICAKTSERTSFRSTRGPTQLQLNISTY